MGHMSKRVASTVAIVSLLWAGIPVSAATSQAADKGRAAIAALHAGAFGTPQAMRLTLERARFEAVPLLLSENPKVVARAKRTIQMYNIANARTKEQRHELIQRLPVTVDRQESVSGTAVTYSARGKVRLQLTLAATPFVTGNSDVTSGPSAETTMDDCYDGPPPCATSQEMDDLGILIADSVAEMDNAQSEGSSIDAEYSSFCGENPEWCSPVLGGPSVDEDSFGCWGSIAGLFGGIGATLGLSAGASAAATSAAAAGTVLTSATVTAFNIAIAASGVGTLVMLGVAGYCVYQAVYVRVPDFAEPRIVLALQEGWSILK